MWLKCLVGILKSRLQVIGTKKWNRVITGTQITGTALVSRPVSKPTTLIGQFTGLTLSWYMTIYLSRLIILELLFDTGIQEIKQWMPLGQMPSTRVTYWRCYRFLQCAMSKSNCSYRQFNYIVSVYQTIFKWSVVVERSRASGSSSGGIIMLVRILAWPVTALVSLSKTHNHIIALSFVWDVKPAAW